ncbi:Flagellar hook-associated protein FliD [hydrothermal vent metagenome]|uniref:Filament cap protein n=1 Tax=hydrothermal vent metagenome TaxID=652676 RepID=A0A1W1BBT1_9ZZZZ
MGISSVGVGSGILTQDVLDQLRAADDSQRVRPITLNLANENDKQDSLKVIDATMTNFRDAINELQTATAFDERKTTVTGTSVTMTASNNSDLQDFTLNVTQLATKRIEQSGTFQNAGYPADPTLKYDPKVDTIATGAGTLQFNVTGMATPIDIEIDATTTLDDLKKAINLQAGDYGQATIVQTADGQFNLFISSTETGASKDISITDSGAVLKGTELTTGMDAIVGAEGQDSAFEFNGQAITRTTNNIDDLITGYDITLEEVGFSSVKVEQDRESIESKVDSFVEKYNSIITELGKQTLASTDSETRGIFSGDSSIKSMKRAIEDMIYTVSGNGGTMADYGFDVDRDGKMSIDKAIFNTKLDENPNNVEAFFRGGDFQTDSTTTVTITGAFSGFYDIVNGYSKTNGGLDLIKDSISQTITALEERKISATERLDAKYEIMKKQFTAYNALINSFNSASDVFTQLANQNN